MTKADKMLKKLGFAEIETNDSGYLFENEKEDIAIHISFKSVWVTKIDKLEVRVVCLNTIEAIAEKCKELKAEWKADAEELKKEWGVSDD